MEVGDDVVGVGLLGVDGDTAWVTPERPPIVNSTMSPMANSIAVVKRSLPPHMVSVQLTIFTPVGMAINIVLTRRTRRR